MHSIHASEQPMTRRRRRQDARWSASFSLTIVNGSVRTPIAVDVCDADLESLLKGLVGRAQFRFRFNGKSRAYSVPLVNGANEAVAFRNLLRVAITEDWDLVGSRPTPPQPVASGHAAEFSLPHARSERSRLWPGRH
jgi:hypothetical protein